MSEMKSAWEKALEKVEKLGKPTDEELKKFEYIPAGNKLAAEYLSNETYNLDAELTRYKDSGGRQHVIQGIQEIFLRNITLPRNDHDKKTISKAMEGIRIIKENKKQLETIYEQINNLLTYYEQALQQTFAQFKQSFEAKIQETSKALQQRQAAGQSIEVELQQQFQDEWHRASSQLDIQYEKALNEHKQQILQTA